MLFSHREIQRFNCESSCHFPCSRCEALDFSGLRLRSFRAARSGKPLARSDRKSTRLNYSHQIISYAVFCLKKKQNKKVHNSTKKKKIDTAYTEYQITND